MKRKITKAIHVGGVTIGGGADIAVQSMTNTDTRDVAATVAQIDSLYRAGCKVVRLAIPDMEAAHAVYRIREQSPVPLVADIHFDYRLALEAVAAGIDKIRINPGNIGGDDRVKAVARACAAHSVPIRIGVNGGSLEKDILAKYGAPTCEAMVESAFYHVKLLNRFDFDDIAISMKCTQVEDTIAASEAMSARCDYPIHIGMTHAGTEYMGTIKNAVGIGALLCRGIGDTIRVSLTADPVREVEAGYAILRAVGLQQSGVEVIACPTCGRCRIELIDIAREVERRVAAMEVPLKVAVMGCAVNGPGEAKSADLGIAGGDGMGLLFSKGEILRRVPQEKLVDELIAEIEKRQKEWGAAHHAE